MMVPLPARNTSEKSTMLQHGLELYTQDFLQRTNSTSPLTSPSISPTTSRKPAMSFSASSSASASPTLQPRAFSPTSTSAAPVPRPRKVSSQAQLPEPIPEHDVPEFKLSPSPIDQDPLDIKAILTELLNCDQVRGDAQMRSWIQSRLMDAELEQKRQRRRRVSLPTTAIVPEDTRQQCTDN